LKTETVHRQSRATEKVLVLINELFVKQLIATVSKVCIMILTFVINFFTNMAF